MRAITIKEAKAHLNELAAIVPITAEQLEIVPELSDAQADRFWARIAEERRSGKLQTFDSAAAAVEFLQRPL